MDVLSAAFRVVHDAEGGAGVIATFLGKARGTLDHEVNPPNASTAKLGLVDAVKISKRVRDYRILYAFADECGHVCLPRGEIAVDDPSTQGVLRRATDLAREVAETFAELNAALADGQVTSAELSRVERECVDAIGAIADVARAMREKADADAEVARSRGERGRR